jgi:glucokinase
VTVIAIDLGGTKVASAIVSEEGEIVTRSHELLGDRRGSGVAELIAAQCRLLLDSTSDKRKGRPRGVGVIVPGIYHADRGTVWAPNIPGWDDYPLRDELESALGSRIGVVIDSDRAGYILGETWRGAARDARDAIFLAVGTGIGAGILVDGQVVRGHADVAGAIGWLALDRPFLSRYTNRGCFEYHASGPGLTTVAREMVEATADYDGALRHVGPEELTPAFVFDAYERGDEIARRVLDDAVQFWGMAVANLVSIFNPETIVFGGGVFGPAVRFLDRIGDEARRWAQPIAMQQVRLAGSSLGGDAGLYGAARLALQMEHAGSSSLRSSR